MNISRHLYVSLVFYMSCVRRGLFKDWEATLIYGNSAVCEAGPGLRARTGQLWTRAIAVDGWEMLLVGLIIQCLVGVGSA